MRPVRLAPAAVLLIACVACTPAQPPPPAPVVPTAAATPAPPPPPPPHGPMPKFVPPSRSAAAVPSGTYSVEPNHTQVMFSVLHLGISTYYGTFSGASGTLSVDAGHPSADTLEVSVPVASVHTTSAKLDGELTSADWLDAGAFPTMTFKSTKVIPTGKGTARVLGDLTLHGVTRPVVFAATFQAAGNNPMMGKLNIGFSVTGTIRRSDFGVGRAIPMVSDETRIIISAAFTQ